jgi:hypothetical protein
LFALDVVAIATTSYTAHGECERTQVHTYPATVTTLKNAFAAVTGGTTSAAGAVLLDCDVVWTEAFVIIATACSVVVVVVSAPCNDVDVSVDTSDAAVDECADDRVVVFALCATAVDVVVGVVVVCFVTDGVVVCVVVLAVVVVVVAAVVVVVVAAVGACVVACVIGDVVVNTVDADVVTSVLILVVVGGTNCNQRSNQHTISCTHWHECLLTIKLQVKVRTRAKSVEYKHAHFHTSTSRETLITSLTCSQSC